MASELESSFPRAVDRSLITQPTYHVYDWQSEHRLSFTAIEVTFGFDGYQQLAEDAALGRQVSRWRTRNPHLAAQLDAEAALDALAGDGL
ncbi:MAG: hypothetical protein ACKV2O_08890 [Acidimicrobiales bacterium]